MYDQLGYDVLYGPFAKDSGLEAFFYRQGFIPLGAGIPAVIQQLGVQIWPDPGERLFIRYRGRRIVGEPFQRRQGTDE